MTDTLHAPCHCGDCQKMHGNFNAFLAAPLALRLLSTVTI